MTHFDSGITTLNLALSNAPDKGYAPGNMVNIIGEPDSGKTMLALTTCAASFYSGKIVVVYYDFEHALAIDVAKLFGTKFAKGIEIVRPDGDTIFSAWQKDVTDRLKKTKKPIIMVVDSFDAVTTEVELEAMTNPGKVKSGQNITGAKGRESAQYLREIQKLLSDKGSVMLLLSHAKQNIGADSFFKPLRRSGGAALGFYCAVHAWLYKSTVEKVSYGDKDLKIGGWAVLDITRNKNTGTMRKLSLPIYPTIGIDNTRAILHLLTDYCVFDWCDKKMATIDAGEFGKGKTAEICAQIEGDPEQMKKLVALVSEHWNKQECKVEQTIGAGRKPRFA